MTQDTTRSIDSSTQQTFRIERLGHRGDGVVAGSGAPIHIHGVLPGEIVAGDLTNGRVMSQRIITPSSDRVTPPCPHARRCGGCTLQHMKEAALAIWKQDIVHRTLVQAGLDAPLRPITTSPPRSRRRATFTARRTKAGALLGFHAVGSDTLIDTPHCRLVDPALQALRPALLDITRTGATRKAALRVTATKVTEGIDLAVGDGRVLDPSLRAELAQTATASGIARLTWNGEPIAQVAPPTVRFDGVSVRLPAGGFLQATEHGEAALRAAVTEAVGPSSRIVDLFSGCGTFALPLGRTGEVHAVEGTQAMTEALDHAWRHTDGLYRVTSETRDLFRRPLLSEEINRFDAAVMDPPRAGAAAQTSEIAASNIARVAAVSCNPATFARDAAILVQAGFRIDWVQVVDQFRWSPHIELAAALSRDHMAR